MGKLQYIVVVLLCTLYSLFMNCAVGCPTIDLNPFGVLLIVFNLYCCLQPLLGFPGDYQ